MPALYPLPVQYRPEHELAWLAYQRELWGENWCIATRRSRRTDAQGYDPVVTPKQYAEARRAWELETFGAPLASIEKAAPDLFRAVRDIIPELEALAERKSTRYAPLHFALECCREALAKVEAS